MEFRTDGKVIYLLDGVPVLDEKDTLSVPVDNNYKAGIVDVHAGLQINTPDKNNGVPAGVTIYNSGLRVIRYR